MRNKLFTKIIVIVAACVMCFGALVGCNRTTPESDNTDQSVYTQGKVQIACDELVEIGGSISLSASAHARKGNGNYITAMTGFSYESSDPTVVTVSADGVVRGVGEGIAEIKVKHAQYGAENSVSVICVDMVSPDLTNGTGLSIFGRAKSDENGLTLTNAASGFSTRVKGNIIKATLLSQYNETLRIKVDEKDMLVQIEGGAEESVITLTSLESGIHSVSAYKTSGADSSLIIKNIAVENGGFYTPPQLADRTLTVVGNSTVLGSGLGKEGGCDATQSYAFTVAQSLGYKVDIIGSSDATLSQVDTDWSDGAPQTADAILLHVGEKDVKNKSIVGFGTAYKSLLTKMREKYADAKIICAYGGDAYSNALGNSVKRAVAELNDPKTSVLPLKRIDDKLIGSHSDEETPYTVWHDEAADSFRNALADSAAEIDYDTEKDDMHVIILAGQSNMEGNSHFRYLIDNDNNFERYKAGFDGIKMSFANHENDAEKLPDFQSVKLGFGGARNNGETWNTASELSDKAAANGYSGTFNDTFGPEIGMARVLSENGYNDNLCFIKFAIGGTSFYNSTRNWQAPDGTLYNAFTTYVDACLAKLSENYNISLDAMFWMQGESDADTASAVNAYSVRCGKFIDSVREHYSKYNSDIYFYDSLIVWYWNQGYTGINTQKKTINEITKYHRIIDNVAANLSQGMTALNVIDTNICEPLGHPDGSHYNAADEIKLGEMYAQAYMNDFPSGK